MIKDWGYQLDPVTKKLRPIELVANGVNKMKKVLSVGDSPAKVRAEARNVALPWKWYVAGIHKNSI